MKDFNYRIKGNLNKIMNYCYKKIFSSSQLRGRLSLPGKHRFRLLPDQSRLVFHPFQPYSNRPASKILLILGQCQLIIGLTNCNLNIIWQRFTKWWETKFLIYPFIILLHCFGLKNVRTAALRLSENSENPFVVSPQPLTKQLTLSFGENLRSG